MYQQFEPMPLDYFRGPSLKTCRTICNIIAATALCIMLLIVFLMFVMEVNIKIHVVYVDTTEPIRETSDKFLSFALDSSVIAEQFHGFDMSLVLNNLINSCTNSSINSNSNMKLLKLIAALSPAYFRIGGTLADRLTFRRLVRSRSEQRSYSQYMDGGQCSFAHRGCGPPNRENFTMSGHQWLELYKLAEECNLNLLFDLNALKRYDNGSWNSENAEHLIGFSNLHRMKVIWELGNEPNSFRHEFNYDVPPETLAKDFATLRQILDKYPIYQTSLLVGPDTTRPQIDHKESQKYLSAFLNQSGNVVDAITWHQYYFGATNAKIEDFLNPQVFDVLKWQIAQVRSIAEQNGAGDTPIWLGETSSAYGGGVAGMSDRFVGTFIWLDKLGVSATNGLDVVIRQSIFRGNYALISANYEPAPDWWLSVLYKHLVAPKVVRCLTTNTPYVRLYCQCTPPKYLRANSSITVYGMNMQRHSAKIRIEGIESIAVPNPHDRNFTVEAYILTTPQSLTSKFISLNGAVLNLTESDDLPEFKPKIIGAFPYVELPPYSLFFLVVPVGDLLACS